MKLVPTDYSFEWAVVLASHLNFSIGGKVKTRIEVWVDIDMPTEDIERMRKNLEDAAWYVIRTHIGVHPELRQSANPFVQANEVMAP